MFLLLFQVYPFVWCRIYISHLLTVKLLHFVGRIFGISFIRNIWGAGCWCFWRIGWSSRCLCRVRCCRGSGWKRWNASLIVHFCQGIAHNARVPFLIMRCQHLRGWIAAWSRRSESAGAIGAGARAACWIAWLAMCFETMRSSQAHRAMHQKIYTAIATYHSAAGVNSASSAFSGASSSCHNWTPSRRSPSMQQSHRHSHLHRLVIPKSCLRCSADPQAIPSYSSTLRFHLGF